MRVEQILIERLHADPNNPRRDTVENVQRLAASIGVNGVQVPLLGYEIAGGVMVGDGHCRLLAAKQLGLRELPVVVLPYKPSEGELLLAQLTINGHRQSLNPVEECEAFVRLAKLRGWTAGELAAGLGVSNAEVTRVLAIGRLTAEERELVRMGRITKSAAYALSRLPEEQRRELAKNAAAGEVTRDQLQGHARRKRPADGPKLQRVTCPVRGGTVSVQAASGLNLTGLVELLEDLIRECKKARSLGVDISTALKMLRDRSQAAATVPVSS